MVDVFFTKDRILSPAERILSRVETHESYGIRAECRATGEAAQQVLHHLEVYEARMFTMRTLFLDILSVGETMYYGTLSSSLVRLLGINQYDYEGSGKRDSLVCEETFKILLAQLVREGRITMTAKIYAAVDNNTRITRIS